MAKVDPIKMEVLRNRFISIVEEMGVVLRRTALSPNIREREDCSCILANPRGEIIAQADHIPAHLGMLAMAMKKVVERFPLSSWNPGDVLIFNLPEAGSHLPDIRVVIPLFAKGRLIGFSANLAHHADVGGIAPGSMPSTATELIQEGILIPYLKLYEEGRLNKALLDIILANVRTPEEREGDLNAQIAAAQRGQKRLEELIEEIGVEEYFSYTEEILNYSERLMRVKIEKKLPKGRYQASLYMDDDGITHEPIPIQAALEIQRDEIKIDFTGTASERMSAVNAPWSFTISACYYVVKSIVDPEIPTNSGCYRPIKVFAPEGSILNCSAAMPCASANETWQRIAETVISAFVKADPTIAKAPSHGCMNNILIGGIDPKKKKAYAYYETIGGGDGARHNKDGMDGVHVLGTNTMNTPIEVVEMSYPLRIEAYELIEDSGGPGKYRGGLGIKRVYRVLDHTATVTVNSDWVREKPEGIRGGEQGYRTRFVINEGRDEEYVPDFSKFLLQLGPSETLSIYTGGGNGYGLSWKRDAEKLLEDICEGKVSLKEAKKFRICIVLL